MERAGERIAAEQCLRDTGAIKRCSRCADSFLIVNDEGAEERAYARAEHLRRAGLRGFAGMTDRQVAEAVKSALDSLSDACPYCSC